MLLCVIMARKGKYQGRKMEGVALIRSLLFCYGSKMVVCPMR